MTRALSKEFFNEFYSGKFEPLKKLINADGAFRSRFMFNLRGNQVMIYCKGHRAVIINENNDDLMVTKEFYKPELKSFIECEMELKTGRDNAKNDNDKEEAVVVIQSVDLAKFKWEKFLSLVADGIEATKTSQEKDAQQRIWYENNVSNIANASDYMIVDTEYTTPKSGRLDLVALHWPAHKSKPGLAVIELKYANLSVGSTEAESDEKETTTLFGHWKKFHRFDLIQGDAKENCDELKDLTRMFWQLWALGMYNTSRTIADGLLKEYCPKNIDWENENRKKIDWDKADWRSVDWDKMDSMIDIKKKPIRFVFALANYNIKSKGITKQIELIEKYEEEHKKEFKGKKHELRFALASFLGYGLFDKSMLDLEQTKRFIEIFRDGDK